MKEVTAMNTNDKEYLVQKIRSQYTEKQHTELDELRRLDYRVKKPVKIFAYIFGSIGAIIMGFGMSLVMTDIGDILNIANTMFTGIIIGIVGMFIDIINYPMYKGILNKRRAKYADKILKLSDRVMSK